MQPEKRGYGEPYKSLIEEFNKLKKEGRQEKRKCVKCPIMLKDRFDLYAHIEVAHIADLKHAP